MPDRPPNIVGATVPVLIMLAIALWLGSAASPWFASHPHGIFTSARRSAERVVAARDTAFRVNP